MKLSQPSEELLETLQKMGDLHYTITCTDDVNRILSEHHKKITLLIDLVGLLAREANIRIDRAKAKQNG